MNRITINNATVEELIDKLSTLPKDLKVTFCGSETGYIHMSDEGYVIIDYDDLDDIYDEEDVMEFISLRPATHDEALAQVANKVIREFKEKFPDTSADMVSDGYHTFSDLYYHRTLLFASLCHLNKHNAWKSKLHSDGTMFDDMFIVGINTKNGQATYHCDMKYWNIFNIKELDNAPEYDGHTPNDAIERIYQDSLQGE